MLVQFTRKVPPYNIGETAGFPTLEADRLIRLGAAALVKESPAAPAPSPVQGHAYPDRSMPQASANRQMGSKGR